MVMIFGDDLRKERHAIGAYSIAALCCLATLFKPDTSVFGFIPLNFSIHPALSFYTLVTAQFLHLDVFHLIGNLIFLLSFGRSVENLVGTMNFIGTLIGIGAFAFVGSWLQAPNSPVPIIGISGSLSVLLGAYTVLFPRAKLRILPFLRFIWFRAWFFSVIWIGLQIWDAFTVGEKGVAYFTHIAGFIIGIVAGLAWKELALDTDRLIAQLSASESDNGSV